MMSLWRQKIVKTSDYIFIKGINFDTIPKRISFHLDLIDKPDI